jgi:hypothetical protein
MAKKLPEPLFIDETAKCEIVDGAGCTVANCWNDEWASEIMKRCNLHNEFVVFVKEAAKDREIVSNDKEMGLVSSKLAIAANALLARVKGK